MFEISTHHSSHNKFEINNIELGKEGERMVTYFLREHWKLPVEGNDLVNSYTRQRGADVWHEPSGFYGEVKNLSGNYYLSRQWVDEHIIPHFPENAKIKVLFISRNTLTAEAQEYLYLLDIHVVEWGKQLTGQNWRSAIGKMYNQLWSIYYKLNKWYTTDKIQVSSISNVISTGVCDPSVVCTLDMYVDVEKKDKVELIGNENDKSYIGFKKRPPDLGRINSWGILHKELGGSNE